MPYVGLRSIKEGETVIYKGKEVRLASGVEIANIVCDECKQPVTIQEILDEGFPLSGFFHKMAHIHCGLQANKRLPTIGEWERGEF